jgi:23S rRNA pseudoU1915 N3-methylase RlmH
VQRTEWNVRDSDAALIITGAEGLSASIGTSRAHHWARQHGKPELVVDTREKNAASQASAWVLAQQKRFGAHMTLSIGGPRESEVPGIYARARTLIAAMLDQLK